MKNNIWDCYKICAGSYSLAITKCNKDGQRILGIILIVKKWGHVNNVIINNVNNVICYKCMLIM